MTEDARQPLAGRRILVTGASRGLGQAVARGCAHAGATVLAAARNVRALEALADELVAAGCAEPLLVPINLQTAGVDDYALVAEHIETRLGGLDGLVLAAAMLGDLTPLSHYDTVTWARVFQVNLHASLLLAQACRPLLRQSGHGRVVFTLADEAYEAKANWGAYAVSKFALRGLFELWAQESRDDAALSVNAVVPPPLRTKLRMDAFPAIDAASLPEPDCVVAAYLGLLGDAAPHGKLIRVPAPAGS